MDFVAGERFLVDLPVFGGLIAATTLTVLLLVHFVFGRRRERSSFRKDRESTFRFYNRIGDPSNQLRHVMAASFYKKKVMSKAEYKVFRIVEVELRSQGGGYRVLSQTSLGEIIGSDNKKAFDSINSKRVDILIIGPYGEPVAAIEYQGGTHHQGFSAARDAIKREALRRAGVEFIEVLESHTPEEIAHLVRRLFRLSSKPAGATSSQSWSPRPLAPEGDA